MPATNMLAAMSFNQRLGICIPTYKRPDQLWLCVQSVIAAAAPYDVPICIADDSADGMHEVAQLGPGSVFGEMALLTGETRTADVVALADVTAIEITKDALHPVLAAHPEFANAISHKVAERRLRLHELQSASSEEEELTIRSRILSFFGLRES